MVALALLAMGIVAAALPRGEHLTPVPAPASERARPASEIDTAQKPSLLAEWSVFLGELCKEPALLTQGIALDCNRASLILSERDFFERSGPALLEEGKDRLRSGVGTLFALLRRRPQIWDSLEAIEIRGHSDFEAQRDPYRTNLVTSQQRALSVAFFLSSEGTLSDRDREDLQSLAVVSGVADSRPPADCPTETRACREQWRRVELRVVLDDAKLRL
ncbi:MAG: hypothetical protein JRG96_03815 [Deltaproteobacteria bacterium]|nr:hypothetical protein [Deltaproteobacteria bacterium]